MVDSVGIYQKAKRIVLEAESRDPLRIAQDLGILVEYVDNLEELLGMYTYKWKTRIILLNSRMDECMTRMVAAHEIGHDILHRDIVKAGRCMQEFVLFNIRDNT